MSLVGLSTDGEYLGRNVLNNENRNNLSLDSY